MPEWLGSIWSSASPHLSALWADVLGLVGSTFVVAVVGSFAGALGGAYGAQRIAEREKFSDGAMKEIRATNVAISLSFVVANTLIGVKKQLVGPIVSRYREARIAAETAIQSGTNLIFEADFRSVQRFAIPVDVLKEHIFSHLSLDAKSIACVTTIEQAIDGFMSCLEERNSMIASFRVSAIDRSAIFPIYFGFDVGGQVRDTQYPDTLNGMEQQLDNAIFYSIELW